MMDTTGNAQNDDRPRTPDAIHHPGVFRLLHGIIDDLKKLVWQQIQLAIHEVQMEADRMVTMVAIAVGLGILTTLCLTFLLLTGVAALYELAGVSLWMSLGLLTVILMVMAGCLGLYLKRQTQRFRILPIRTFHTVKEDVRWIKEWIASSRT